MCLFDYIGSLNCMTPINCNFLSIFFPSYPLIYDVFHLFIWNSHLLLYTFLWFTNAPYILGICLPSPSTFWPMAASSMTWSSTVKAKTLWTIKWSIYTWVIFSCTVWYGCSSIFDLWEHLHTVTHNVYCIFFFIVSQSICIPLIASLNPPKLDPFDLKFVCMN